MLSPPPPPSDAFPFTKDEAKNIQFPDQGLKIGLCGSQMLFSVSLH